MIPATVLDPFVGSGTTCAVAQKLGRRSVGLDASPALSLEHLVEPMLDALGFTAEHRSVEPHRPNVYHLYAEGKPMALLVANALDSTFAGSPGLTNSNPRYRFVREDTGYGGRIAFTNGLNWIVFYGDPEAPPYQFTVDQPEAFWDLFLLAQPNRLVLTERDFTSDANGSA